MELDAGARGAQLAGEARIADFRDALGPFVIAAETTRMAMIFTDAQINRHPLVFANDSFFSLTGFTRAEIMGKGVAFLLKEIVDDRTGSTIESALDEKTSGTIEARCRRADGSEYLATVFFSPVNDREGITRQHFICFVEVSGRIDRLIQQRLEFNELYAKAPGIIAATAGKDHRFIFANETYERLVGRKNFIGRRVKDVMPEIEAQGFIQLLDDVFETGVPFVGERMPITFSGEKNSRTEYVSFVYQPVKDEDGRVTGLFLEGYNATAEHFAAEQLALLHDEIAHASRVNAMGMMAATLAHELNQPLAAISSYAAGLERLLDPASDQAASLALAIDGIKGAAQRAGEVIRNVRELTRRGRTPLTVFDLNQAILECIRLVEVGHCNVTIDARGLDNVHVLGDRVQIQQVVINLVQNGCSAVSVQFDGKVAVEILEAAGKIVVAVTDNGPGLSAEAAQNIFTWTDSTKHGGSGLGLAICRTIVERHGGRIWLENSNRSGSRFCFSMPMTSSQEEAVDA
ncbi:PAS domain-containing sensor histidine kinase [Tsuneonella sp. HG222]